MIKSSLSWIIWPPHPFDSYEESPKADWMLAHVITNNKSEIATGWYDENGKLRQISRIVSLTTTEQSGRSKGARFIILDEFAFVKPNDRATWRAIRPILARGGQSCMISTPNGVGGVYYDRVVKARVAKQNGKLDELDFKYHEIDWWDTEITKEQYERITGDMSEDDIRQEFGREFLSSGNPAFDNMQVTIAYRPLEQNPQIVEYLE